MNTIEGDIPIVIVLRQHDVTMGGTNEFMAPQFAFDESASDQLAKIKKGMKLTLACEGTGDIAKIPMSKDCRVLQ